MSIKAYFEDVLAHVHPTSKHMIISGEEHKDSDLRIFVIIEDDGNELFNLQINCEYYCALFRGVTVWNNIVVIGFDTQCYLFNMETKQVVRHKLNSYFDSFYTHDDFVFICSASNINCFNKNGEFVWRSDKLGTDSVKINRIEEDVIFGSGDWGGKTRWKDFEIAISEVGRNTKKPKRRLLRLFNS